MILALDLGGSCGWAIGQRAGSIVGSGWWRLDRPGQQESPGVRYIRLRAELGNMLAAYPGIELVVFEAGHHRGGAATRVLLGYAAMVQEWCAEHAIPVTTCHSGTLKKYATGRANASKDAMLKAWRGHALYRDLKPDATDDEVDACWLLVWAQDALGWR